MLESQAQPREFRPFVRLDEEASELAAKKLGIGECFRGERGDAPEKALEAAKTYEWLIKARFEYKNLRIKVPFMHRCEKGWEVYFLFIGLYPHADDMQFYTDTEWVLRNNGINVADWYIIHLNANYIREEELDPQKLFIVCRSFYNSKNNPTLPVNKAIRDAACDLEPMLEEMDRISRSAMPAPVRTNACTGRQKCVYYDACFPEAASQQINSILTLIGSQHRFEMKNEGLLYLRDADPERIEGSRQQYAQIMADRSADGLFVDRAALGCWLEDISYPVICLDFEWERFAIPPYRGMKPYDVLPFEYSIHILHEDGSLDHRIYLSTHDDREEMIQSLIRDIPSEGTVLAYNAEGAEKIRIRELAAAFPAHAKQLHEINGRMEDLQLPFDSGVIYDIRMRGQWSLKILMSMMDDAGYNDLDIRHGMDAVFEWRRLDQDDDVEDRDKIINDLKAYCGMDSYAMTVLFRWIEKLSRGL